MACEKKSLFRIVDANFNRTKEGLRVCEDICRFIVEDKTSTRVYKNIRHSLSSIASKLKTKKLIEARDITGDVGKGSTGSEFKRKDISDIFYANSQRVKESIRVLEEITKLIDKRIASEFKLIRYKVYNVEKEMAGKL